MNVRLGICKAMRMAGPRRRSWPGSSRPSCHTAWHTSKRAFPRGSPTMSSRSPQRPFCSQAGSFWLYFRLFFAICQDLNAMPMPATLAKPGGFPSIASAGATRPRNEELEGGSLVTIAFRCELRRWSHQVLQSILGTRKPRFNFLGRSADALYPRLEGRGFTAQRINTEC